MSAAVIGEFTFGFTSITITPGTAGNLIGQGNCEGTATGYGTVAGTLTVTPAGFPNGTWAWHAVAWPADGRPVSGSGRGQFAALGGLRWRTDGHLEDSDGRRVRIEGEIDLAARTWAGRLLAG